MSQHEGASANSNPGDGAAPPEGLHSTIQAYLPELIYGANDGLVTTLVVVAGVTGASLSSTVILILGFASLLGDGLSMGASEYLSSRSTPNEEDRPSPGEAARGGWMTYLGFVIAGFVPLLAYLVPWFEGFMFEAALGITCVTLFVIGSARAYFTDRHWYRAGIEMLVVGGLAAAAAYGIGALGAYLTGGEAAMV
jgi:VIT1/CCC1 family predicted Fe2+/Mn2+ transporter